MTVVIDFRTTAKSAHAGGLTSCFLAEAQGAQSKINKTYIFANMRVISAFSAPLRD
jgi:hypothetical protein